MTRGGSVTRRAILLVVLSGFFLVSTTDYGNDSCLVSSLVRAKLESKEFWGRFIQKLNAPEREYALYLKDGSVVRGRVLDFATPRGIPTLLVKPTIGKQVQIEISKLDEIMTHDSLEFRYQKPYKNLQYNVTIPEEYSSYSRFYTLQRKGFLPAIGEPELGSVLSEIPEIKPEVEGLYKLCRETPELFISHFNIIYNRKPTLKEYIKIVSQQRAALIETLKGLMDKYKKYDGEKKKSALIFSEICKKAISVLEVERNDQNYLKGLEKSPKINEVINQETFNSQFLMPTDVGLLGEIEAFIRISGDKTFNVKFEENRNLSALVSSKMSPIIKGTAHEIIDFSKKYPSIWEKVKEHLNINEETDLAMKLITDKNFIMNIIESIKANILRKEIDAICVENGDTFWIEVKNYKKMNHEILHKTHENGNSVYKLAQIMVEIRRFLGLENEVKLQLYFVKGITKEAAKELEDIGYAIRGPRDE